MFLWLLACQSPSECKAGFTAGDDGLCYQDPVDDGGGLDDTGGGDDTDVPEETEPPTLEDVLDAMPACEPVPEDGRLNLEANCADDVCPYDRYAAIVDTLGEEPDCYGFYYEYDGYPGGQLYCAWSNGIEATFDDEDQDGRADDGAYAWMLDLTEVYDGGTLDGLGIGANMACFVDAFGYPTSANFERVDKGWVVSHAYWEDYGFSVDDSYDHRGEWASDGWVDGMTLFAPGAGEF